MVGVGGKDIFRDEPGWISQTSCIASSDSALRNSADFVLEVIGFISSRVWMKISPRATRIDLL